jgi:hypothetical protein
MTLTVRRYLDSETLCLPELRPFLGKNVQIIIIEESEPKAPRPDLSALHALAGNIDLDYDAIEQLRARSIV